MRGQKERVYRFVGHGLTNQEIGMILHISEKTVKAHVGALFKKHVVRNRVELALKYHGIEIAQPVQFEAA